MASLTVVSVAYPFSPVSADSVGGAEQVLALLDRAIVDAGHRSIVIAHERSCVAGSLVAIPDAGETLDPVAVGSAHAAVRRALERVLRDEAVDLVHMHGIDFDRYLPPPGVPLVTTLHLPIAWYSRDALCPRRPDVHLCCVSASQSRGLPSWASPSSVVENGIALDAFRPSTNKHAFVLALGRLCVEKGLHEALDAAKAARIPLFIGGEASQWESHRRYFEDELAPRLRPPHRWLGPIGLARKRRLLAGARCVLVPSRAPETSSLVAMEALASGTPVVAYPSGALASIVEHGRTGFLVDDAAGMARAIGRASDIAPEHCRRSAEVRFSSQKMTEAYLSLYEDVIARAAARRAAPSHGPALALERVEGASALADLAPEWARLWKQCPWATPFQRPEWLLAYAHTFCDPTSTARPWALTVRRDGELVAIAPMCTDTREATTTLLGQGVSDYLDVVARPDVADVASGALLDAIAARCTESTKIVLDALRPDSPLLAAAPPRALDERPFERAPSPVLSLAGKTDPVPKALREKIRYSRRRAEALGPLEIHEAPGNAPFDAWLERLFELHGARWATRGERGVLASPEVRRFHRQATKALGEMGLARVYGLCIGEHDVAATLVLRDARATYYYIGGFDPAYEAVSPGTLLIAHAIERAHGEGAAEVDFLRGAEPYKYRFGAKDRPNRGRSFSARC